MISARMSYGMEQCKEPNERQYRVLIVSAHPVQYLTPLLRLMEQHPALDILVAYCAMYGVERTLDAGFGVEVSWDIPLLDGYPWIHVPNRSGNPHSGGFLRLVNPDLFYLICRRRFDAIIIFTGYTVASFWIALAAAKYSGTALLFGTDAHTIEPRDRKWWKKQLKTIAWPWLFRLADSVIVPSSGGISLMKALGIPDERLFLTPFVVDNDWWLKQSSVVDRGEVRHSWNIRPDDPVLLFCAKLQPWKRPQDVLQAFSQANIPHSWLLYAGDGPMRTELEQMAQQMNIAERVRFLGFVNQSQLPAVYTAADILVFSSEYEPFGVVVNEMMLCGNPVIVSDQVGARFDLVQQGETGFIYPCKDVQALTHVLVDILPDRARLKHMGVVARKHIQTWSPAANVEALLQAVKQAVRSRR